MIVNERLRQNRIETVAQSLREDIGDGDITALLIAGDKTATGRVITRVDARLAGQAWVDEVFRQVDPTVTL
ncbi:MAG: nicotinate-nucleotide diphosphorylase (carboxylating), partial [Marinobacter sp. 34-60-7]